MISEQYIAFLTITLTLVGGAIGYLVREHFEKKKELLIKVNSERREIYQNFINIIVSLTEGNYNTKGKNFKIEINEFYKKYILYASPKVIISLSEFIQLINQNDKKIIQSIYFSSLTRIIIEMRKDLGLKNTNLGSNGEIILKVLVSEME